MESLRIGQLAKRAGVGVETIRFYERKGLIEQPRREGSGYRRYPMETVRRIQFIRRAKELGFTLREIAELLLLREAPGETCAEVQAQASAKLKDIEEKIAMLERMRAVLVRLVSACEVTSHTDECPILAALEQTPDDTA